MEQLLLGDCLEKLKELPENSVDSIVTDPPYELCFMGKSWDSTGIANNVELWKECLRVLKPGGHLLSFSGTRTYHRMAVAIENAGFEIKNMIAWCYGQGFPKSLRVGCNCEGGMLPYSDAKVSLSSKEDLPSVRQGVSMPEQVSSDKKQDMLKGMLGNPNIKSKKGGKKATTPELQTMSEGVLSEGASEEQGNLLLSEVQRDSKVGTFEKVLGKRQRNKEPEEGIENGKEPSVEGRSNLLEETRELQADKVCEMPERISGNGSEGQLHNGTSSNNGNTLKTTANEDRGGASHKSRPTRQQDRESDAIPKQQGTQTIRREICKKCGGVIGMEGYGTALKPAIEPICMAMKPISERTIRLNVAENCLKYGTGGINIDVSRVSTDAYKDDDSNESIVPSHKLSELRGKLYTLLSSCVADKTDFPPFPNDGEYALRWKELSDFLCGCQFCYDLYDGLLPLFQEGDRVSFQQLHDVQDGISRLHKEPSNNHGVCIFRPSTEDVLSQLKSYSNDTKLDIQSQGRFPANLCHDNSEEVRECFPDSKAGSYKGEGSKSGGIWSESTGKPAGMEYGDSGNASRFFKSVEQDSNNGEYKSLIYQAKASKSERNRGCEDIGGNKHCTVKPISLMSYLIKMVTPKGGTVLDPFTGSGSTGVAAIQNGYTFIGIEMEAEYMEIAKARIESAKKEQGTTLFL